MSRHSQTNDDGTELVAGYDTAFYPYYFAQKYDAEGECLWSVATDPNSTLKCHPDYPDRKGWDQRDMAELLQREGAPNEWVDAMNFDLPF